MSVVARQTSTTMKGSADISSLINLVAQKRSCDARAYREQWDGLSSQCAKNENNVLCE